MQDFGNYKSKMIIKKFWAILFIFLVWLVFASPYFFRGLVPYSSTYQVNHFAPWAAYNQFWGPVKNGAMPDVTSQIYPWKKLTIDILKSGQIPFWNPYSFSGTPHLANYQSAVLSPFNLVFFIFSFVDAWSLLVLLQPLLAGLFTFMFLRSLNASNAGSLISALSFMFCGFITVWMGYATLGYAILFLPLALFAIEKFSQTKNNKFGILFAFTLPLSFFSGHFQISIYFLLFIFVYILFNKHRSKAIFVYLFGGLLMTLPQVLPSLELYSQSLRSGLFQKGEVIPWSYLPTIVSPDFFGNPVTRNDWFGHYAEWNSYVGIIPFFLGVYYFLGKRASRSVFLLVMSIAAFLLALDSPLSNLIVVLHIPVLSTSAESRIIVIFSFCLAVAAGVGFDKAVADFGEKKLKTYLKAITIGVLIFGIIWSVVILKLFLPIGKVQVAKSNLILPTALFVFCFVLLRLLKTKQKVIIFLIIFLTAFDMLRFATKWQAFDPKKLVFPQVPVADTFKSISGVDRVYGPFGTEASLYYHLPSIEGYDAVYQQRYGEFIASLNDGKFKEPSRSVVIFPKDGLYAPKVINLMGIAYTVHKVSDNHAEWAFPFWTYPKGQFAPIYKDGIFEVYKNNKSLPRAYMVGKYQIEKNPQKIIDDIFLDSNYGNKVVLEEDPSIPQTDTAGMAKILSYFPSKITIKTESKEKNLLFLSDTFYPGWEAKVDGINTKIYRADYAFRAIVVDRGNHNIEFYYNPKSFIAGSALGVFGLLLIGFTALRKIRI